MLSTILIGLTMQAATAAPAAKPLANPNKRICRADTDTGSLMAKRICHTRAEWAAMDSEDGRYRNNFRDRATNMALPRGS